MAKEIKEEEKEIKTTKIVNITDIKKTKSEWILQQVQEHDVVILRLAAVDLKLSLVTYS